MPRESAELPRTYASLRFAGPRLDPDTISAALGSPTLSYLQGQTYRIGAEGKDQLRSTSLWLLNTKQIVESHDLLDHADYILDLIEGNAQTVRRVSEGRIAAITVSLFWHGASGAERPRMPAAYLGRLQDFDIRLEEDFGTEDDDEDATVEEQAA